MGTMLLYTPFAMCTVEVVTFNTALQLQIVLSPSLSFTIATVLYDSHSEYLMLRHPKPPPDTIWPSNHDFHAKQMCTKQFCLPYKKEAFWCKYLSLCERHLASALKIGSFWVIFWYILEQQKSLLTYYHTKQLSLEDIQRGKALSEDIILFQFLLS